MRLPLVGLSCRGRRDRLSAVPVVSSQGLITIPIRLRWLFAILVAFSLILPHLTPPGAASLSGESAPVAAGHVVASGAAMAHYDDAGSVSAVLPGAGGLPAGELFGDGFAGDYSYETDKLLLLFFMRWANVMASWNSDYVVVESPDPVFSFERPPKSAAA